MKISLKNTEHHLLKHLMTKKKELIFSQQLKLKIQMEINQLFYLDTLILFQSQKVGVQILLLQLLKTINFSDEVHVI